MLEFEEYKVKLNGMKVEQALKTAGFGKGIYMLKGARSGKKIMAAVR